jgi:hypothetical protein
MRWGDLALSYLKALIWPAVVVSVILKFQNQIAALINRVRRISGAGLDLDLAVTERKLQATEREVEREVESTVESAEGVNPTQLPPSLQRALDELPDMASIDSLDPFDAAVDVWWQLDNANKETLRFFGVPASVIDSRSAGKIMADVTGVDSWSGYLGLVDKYAVDISDLVRLSESAASSGKSDTARKRELDMAREQLKALTGQLLRTSAMLPKLLEISITARELKTLSSLPVADV